MILTQDCFARKKNNCLKKTQQLMFYCSISYRQKHHVHVLSNNYFP